MPPFLTAMKFILFTFIFFTFLLIGVAVSAQTNGAKNKRTKPTGMPMSEKIIYEPDADLLREMQEKVRVVESKKDWARFDRQAPIVNSGKNRSAYIAQFKMENDADAMLDVIVVHDKGSDKFYEIRGVEDFPWRPFSEIKWISNDVLQFEQWVNPNNGGRYQVNLKTGKVVAAGYVRSN